jgi:hypothetical protein
MEDRRPGCSASAIEPNRERRRIARQDHGIGRRDHNKVRGFVPLVVTPEMFNAVVPALVTVNT